MNDSLRSSKSWQRDFDTAIPSDILKTIQQGVMRYTYRGVLCNKSPFDLALYHLLLDRLRPATIIEIGTKYGGSAMWFADMAQAHYGGGEVIAIDNAFKVNEFDDRVRYLEGDAGDLSQVLESSLLEQLHHPWLVVEDSAHTFETCTAVLHFFHPHLIADDYIVIEDGILRAMTEPHFERYEDGPARAIHAFLCAHGEYEIDRELCDFFGRNCTYNPGGYLRKKTHRV